MLTLVDDVVAVFIQPVAGMMSGTAVQGQKLFADALDEW